MFCRLRLRPLRSWLSATLLPTAPTQLRMRTTAGPITWLSGSTTTRPRRIFLVLNEGIGGNCVLITCTGPNALARFDRDVLAQAGVRYVIVLESINDIGSLHNVNQPDYHLSAEDLEQGLGQLVVRAHQHGIKVFGATITPYQGAGYFTDKGEQIREAVNTWILTSGVFDGTVDFDKATRDPNHPLVFASQYDSGDHLHPKDAGYSAIADSIDLSLFQP